MMIRFTGWKDSSSGTIFHINIECIFFYQIFSVGAFLFGNKGSIPLAELETEVHELSTSATFSVSCGITG